MDPLSITISILTVLEIGTKASKGLHAVISTWKGAPPAIYALYNEVSDLNLVLDHIDAAGHALAAKGTKYDAHFADALDDHLRQARLVLSQLDELARELKELSSVKKKYKWLFRQSEVAHLQHQLRDIRSRMSDLLTAYNV
jgi:hypothetical protein